MLSLWKLVLGDSYVLLHGVHLYLSDDVYVGIVADRVDEVSRWNLAYYYSFVYESLDKKRISWRFDPVVFYHNPSVAEMYRLWFFYCSYKSCS